MVQKVTAALISQNGKILIAKRKVDDEMGGQWEFPGGTVMPGESPEQAMQREIAEELNVRVRVGRLLAQESCSSGDRNLEVWFFEVFPESFDFTLTEHDEFAWVAPGELEEYHFPEADLNVAALLYPQEE